MLPLHAVFANAPCHLAAVPKGGWESSDGVLEAAASREALEEGLTLYP